MSAIHEHCYYNFTIDGVRILTLLLDECVTWLSSYLRCLTVFAAKSIFPHNFVSVSNRPYSRRGHDEQKTRLGWQIYRKCARQYVNPDVTSLLLYVHVT